MVYPVITLYQPWATWIMRGWKSIETRTHNRFACLKGRTILIHAGQKTDDSDAAVFNPYLTYGQIIYNPDDFVNGFILGQAFVKDCRILNSSHSNKALIDCGNTIRYGLFLTDVLPYAQPIPVKGDMGIWYYDLDARQKVKKNLPQASLFPLT